MEIEFNISKDEKTTIKLIDNNICVAEASWHDKSNLSRNLLKKIDDLLRKSGVSLDRISGYKIISDVPESWTTYRIAKITLEVLAIAKKIGL